jgi:hypothetical protein
MNRRERIVAALLLAVAVAGGALIPRLLSAPAGPLGVALGPGPSLGPSVVQAPAIPKPPRAQARRIAPQAAQPSPIVPTTAKPVARSAVAPAPAPTHHVSSPAKSPPSPSPAPPASSSPPPLPPPPSPPPSVSAPAARPTPTTTPSTAGTRPGNGYGDKNHIHTGPPGQSAAVSTGAEPPRRSHGHDLEGSGHGRPSQAPPDSVGVHDRNVGYLQALATAAAQAAAEAGSHAWPQAGVPCHQGHSPQAVTHAPGHGYGHGGWWNRQSGDG